jgi:hypothetical protein
MVNVTIILMEVTVRCKHFVIYSDFLPIVVAVPKDWINTNLKGYVVVEV